MTWSNAMPSYVANWQNMHIASCRAVASTSQIDVILKHFRVAKRMFPAWQNIGIPFIRGLLQA